MNTTTIPDTTMNRQQLELPFRLYRRAAEALELGIEALHAEELRRADARKASLALKALGVMATNHAHIIPDSARHCCLVGSAAGMALDAYADLIEASETLDLTGYPAQFPAPDELRDYVRNTVRQAVECLAEWREALIRAAEEAQADPFSDLPSFGLEIFESEVAA